MRDGEKLALVLAIGLGAYAFTRAHSSKEDGIQETPPENAIRAIVRREAIRQGVDPILALTWVQLESNFNPRAAGDLKWHLNRERFEKVVPKGNPYRSQPHLWHSYGLFQLLSPYHVRPGEHPHVLYDPVVNAARGVAFLKRKLQQAGGDPRRARLLYTGAWRASQAHQDHVLGRLDRALTKQRGLA